VFKELGVFRVIRELKELKVLKVIKVLKVPRVLVENMGHKELKVFRVPKDF
jgi:hypothetical protein